MTLALPNSTPTLCGFDPRVIPWQWRFIRDIHRFDYSLGVHEVLLSGSYGSAKSACVAHVTVKHCLDFPGARACVARYSLTDLRDTFWKDLLDHISEDLIEGVDYWVNEARMEIRFSNGSTIITRSFHDRNYKKWRSLRLSLLVIEEAVELDDKRGYEEAKARVGRVTGIPVNLVICVTNPDSPAHWMYEYFIEGERKYRRRHVYYSTTRDNPFLPPSYDANLQEDLDPKAYDRYGRGHWIDLITDTIYYAYDPDVSFLRRKYELDPTRPVNLCWDFNIGLGKPLSMCLTQTRDVYRREVFVGVEFHVFAEVVIEGADTELVCEELANRRLLDLPVPAYVIYGDATGASRSTNSKRSDYDIIRQYLAKHRTQNGQALTVDYEVPKANPPIRRRHNRMNAACRSRSGRTMIYVYETAPTTDKGMRLTALKKGGSYIEDDSKPYQHVTTALGYHVDRVTQKTKGPKPGIRREQIR